MSDLVSQATIILEVTAPIGKKIRMHDSYWQKILNDKHKELKYGLLELKSLLVKPDQVRISIKDDTIYLFYKQMEKHTLVCAVKVLNGDGFVVTFYQTSEPKPKGEIVWQK